MKFAKLFDVGERQVVTWVSYDGDGDGDADSCTLHQLTYLTEEVEMDLKLGGPEKVIRAIWAHYDQQVADAFFASDTVRGMIEALA